MTSQQRKRLFTALRVVLCVFFLAWALHGVSLHDRVTLKLNARLADAGVAGEATLRLMAEDADSVTVRLPNGQEMAFPRSQIARDPDDSERVERGLLTALRGSRLSIIGLALLIFGPVPFLQSLRLQLMLRAQEIELTYWEAIKLSFGGNFLNFFLLGTTAGDVFKAYYATLHTTRKTEAVTTILLDRFVGLSGLLIVSVIAIFMGSDDARLDDLRIAAFIILGGIALAAVLTTSKRMTSLAPQRLLDRLPFVEHARRAHAATDRLVRHKPLIFTSLAIAVVLQWFAIGAGVTCAYALDMDFSGSKAWDYFAYIGSGHCVAAIPISFQGLGTMELTFKQFFLDRYGTLSQLLCLALWLRVMQLVWALPGALVTLTGAYRPKQMAASLPDEPIAEAAMIDAPKTASEM